MKKFAAVALFALASVAFAQDKDTVAIRNICDSLGNTMMNIVPAYFDETVWVGNPHTMVKDSSWTRHYQSYDSLTINISTNKTLNVPLSIKAACVESDGLTVEFAKWTTNKTWAKDTAFNYSTYIYDIHALKGLPDHDSTNTYNLLAFVEGGIPDDLSFKSSELLFSSTFEFAFEWWFAGASYTHVYDEVKADSSVVRHMQSSYASSVSNDSLKAFENALSSLSAPDTMKSIRIQVLKVVLVDSLKLSSSSEVSSSSSANPVSCSGGPSSSSSSSEGKSSSSVVPPSSSSEAESSSSAKPETSSSSTPETSSSEAESSSSEGTTRIFSMESPDASKQVVQVRRLDGSVVKSSEKLGPGVYYVKYSTGIWQKKAVLSK